MIGFLLRRLVWLVLTLWVVFTATFWLMQAAPGGPLNSDRKFDPVVEQNLKRRFNLDKPPWEQYLIELGNVARGDLGYSTKMADFTVNQVIAEGFPVSAALGLLALVFAISAGLVAGIAAAVMRGRGVDVALMSAATVGIALPNFVIAGIMILLFVFIWPLFPAAGWGSASQLVLPGFCLGAPYAAYIARLTRTGMLDVLNQDYIRTARAKGLSLPAIIYRHALRGGLLPVVSYLGPAVTNILTGSLVVEQIFAIPGLGVHFVQAALQGDYPLAMGVTLFYTVLIYSLNTIVDIAYGVLDPRVRLA